MGVKSVYCVSIVYNFYAGCTKVAPGIRKERRLVQILGEFIGAYLGRALNVPLTYVRLANQIY